jgi:hypothetical protein
MSQLISVGYVPQPLNQGLELLFSPLIYNFFFLGKLFLRV